MQHSSHEPVPASDRKSPLSCPCLVERQERTRRHLLALNMLQPEPNHEDYVPRGDAE